MFLLTRPNAKLIGKFIDDLSGDALSYPEVGATQNELPADYTIDRNSVILGSGQAVFAKASQALRGWRMFDLGWVELFEKNTSLEPGRNVAVLANHIGFYSLNGARIVYTLDENDGTKARFGFAYGTLSEHAEVGEERFSIEHDLATDEVCYQLLAMSRPGHILAKLGYPIGRRLQQRFARDSMNAMVKAVRNTL